MTRSSPAKKKLKRRTIGIAIVLILATATAMPLVREHAAKLLKDPERAPPQTQIANQTKKLLEKRSKVVIPDDEIGFRLPPGLNQLVETYDFEFRRQTDSHGFPNRGEWPEQTDLVFLGDSLIVGEGVGIGGAFVTLIDDAMHGMSAMNLGMPGAGLERQYRIFDKYGIGLEPRLVVACFYVASDLNNDTQFLEWLEDSEGMSYNAYRLSYSRRHEKRSRGSLISRLQGHVYYELARSIIEPRLWGERRLLHRKIMPDETEILFNSKMVKFAKRVFTGSEPEFENFRETLDRLQAAVAKIDSELAFVLMPSKEELFAVDPDRYRGNAVALIAGELEQRDIPVLDLYPVLQSEGRRSTVFFRRDAHLNQRGNEVVARAFLDWLQKSKILD